MYSLVGLGGPAKEREEGEAVVARDYARGPPLIRGRDGEMRSTWRVTTDALITGNYRCLIN